MRVAVVGAGVSGLVAAHLLHRQHEVTVYEAESYAGGHTNTVRVDTADATHWVDTGFIVLNDRNYPNFTRLLSKLGVATQPSHMGFSVKGEEEDFEYAGTPRGVFCQGANLRRPAFWRMIADLVRFNRELRALLAGGQGTDPDASLGGFLERGGYSAAFVRRLIVPQASAVWSADPASMWAFPVRFLAEFFANHGMLGFSDRPAWSTVAGGSVRYVEALTRPFSARIRLGSPVRSVTRDAAGVEIVAAGGAGPERYDAIVLACHADQALSLLADPSADETEVLRAIPYQRNEAVLHTDSTLLPRRRAARQAWNFHLLAQPKPQTTVTYWMNRLQRLRAREDFCVTLNRSEAIDPAKVIRTISYAHPVFTERGVRAQSRHATISGVNRTHYCGAYWGWGFHEDGVVSALQACAPFGVRL
jgi:predicted NAD/FAD-binding protein